MVTDEQLACERRQLLLMRDRLAGFTARALSLPLLINDLEALVWELELASDDWKDGFLMEWGELEIAYSVALDRGEAIRT